MQQTSPLLVDRFFKPDQPWFFCLQGVGLSLTIR